MPVAAGKTFRNLAILAELPIQFFEFLHGFRILRLGVNVHHLGGVLVVVEKHPFVAGPEVGKSIAFRTEAVVARSVVFPGIFIEGVIQRTGP